MADYNAGLTLGNIQGQKDSRLLIPPSPLTKDNDDIYQLGYRNGYYIGYTKGLASMLKANNNNDLKDLIATRLNDVSESMLKEHSNDKQKRY